MVSLFSMIVCGFSRNTAQKQWDETLVLVIGGLTRILRSSFTFLLTLNNFWAGKLDDACQVF